MIGADLSPSMLTETRRRILRSGLPVPELVRCDCAKLPFRSASIDAVHAGAAMHCWPNLSEALAEIYRVLKPGGVFFASTFFTSSIDQRDLIKRSARNQGFYLFKSENEIKKLVEAAGFRDEGLYGDSIMSSSNGGEGRNSKRGGIRDGNDVTMSGGRCMVRREGSRCAIVKAQKAPVQQYLPRSNKLSRSTPPPDGGGDGGAWGGSSGRGDGDAGGGKEGGKRVGRDEGGGKGRGRGSVFRGRKGDKRRREELSTPADTAAAEMSPQKSVAGASTSSSASSVEPQSDSPATQAFQRLMRSAGNGGVTTSDSSGSDGGSSSGGSSGTGRVDAGGFYLEYDGFRALPGLEEAFDGFGVRRYPKGSVGSGNKIPEKFGFFIDADDGV